MVSLRQTRRRIHKLTFLLQAFVLLAASLAPMFLNSNADAAQLTSRKVTISSSKVSQTGVTYTFDFTTTSSTAIRSMAFTFCTTALGTCTKPTNMDANHTTASVGSQTFTNAMAFTEYTGVDAGACTDHDGGSASTQYCVTRSETLSETAAAKSFTINNITNPSTTNTAIYVRIALYSDAAFATAVHDGTVAASTAQQITVNGRVQEVLKFCIAAVDDGGGTDTGFPTTFEGCTAISNTIVDLGVIENTSINKSPVPNSTSKQGNARYGLAYLSTNASSGVAVTYYAETNGTNQERAFRVSGATCNVDATNLLDQCFRSAVNTTAMAAGTENFGLNVPCVTTSGTTTNISVATAYNADGTTTGSTDCENTDTSNKFEWNATSTAATIASSSSVVDNEAIRLRYAATSSATTPTGSYTVVSTYIATPTF